MNNQQMHADLIESAAYQCNFPLASGVSSVRLQSLSGRQVRDIMPEKEARGVFQALQKQNKSLSLRNFITL